MNDAKYVTCDLRQYSKLRRSYYYWFIGGIIFGIGEIYNLFFDPYKRDPVLAYAGILVPIFWLSMAMYFARKLRRMRSQTHLPEATDK